MPLILQRSTGTFDDKRMWTVSIYFMGEKGVLVVQPCNAAGQSWAAPTRSGLDFSELGMIGRLFSVVIFFHRYVCFSATTGRTPYTSIPWRYRHLFHTSDLWICTRFPHTSFYIILPSLSVLREDRSIFYFFRFLHPYFDPLKRRLHSFWRFSFW